MVYYVISEVDRREPILVREVEFMRGESLKAFEMRMHEVEHEIIVRVGDQEAMGGETKGWDNAPSKNYLQYILGIYLYLR
jgi:folate-dependent phosphoribosylglycinamide formyltransferase PurN